MKEELIIELYRIGCVKFGEFTLKSGQLSPIYIDLRLLVSHPQLLKKIARAIWQKVEGLHFDLVCGVPYTALPIATALSIEYNIPMVMRRKEAKDYGTKKLIEGSFAQGQSCLIIEDLITSGLSIFETIQPLEAAGLTVKDIVVLLDREQGGAKKLKDKNYHLHSVLKINDLLEVLHNNHFLESNVVEKVKNFLMTNQVS